MVDTLVSLKHFTFFLVGLSDLDDSAIFKFCFEYFSKDLYMSKNFVYKNKANAHAHASCTQRKKLSRNY